MRVRCDHDYHAYAVDNRLLFDITVSVKCSEVPVIAVFLASAECSSLQVLSVVHGVLFLVVVAFLFGIHSSVAVSTRRQVHQWS
jgi:hypothetical protein